MTGLHGGFRATGHLSLCRLGTSRQPSRGTLFCFHGSPVQAIPARRSHREPFPTRCRSSLVSTTSVLSRTEKNTDEVTCFTSDSPGSRVIITTDIPGASGTSRRLPEKNYSTTPCIVIVFSVTGIFFPDRSRAWSTTYRTPLQHGTSMWTTMIDLISWREKISASFVI